MPVEIRELVLRATVEPPQQPGAGGEGDGVRDHNREEIVAACVREVLKILERSKER